MNPCTPQKCLLGWLLLSIPCVSARMLEAGMLMTHVLSPGTRGLHHLFSPATSSPCFALGKGGLPWEKHYFRHELCQFSA